MGKEAWEGCNIEKGEVRPVGWLDVLVRGFLRQVGMSSNLGTDEREVAEGVGSAKGC